MKVVDLIARIPEHLDLHFSDFSMNFYTFSKFAVLETKEKERTFCAEAPGRNVFLADTPLAGV